MPGVPAQGYPGEKGNGPEGKEKKSGQKAEKEKRNAEKDLFLGAAPMVPAPVPVSAHGLQPGCCFLHYFSAHP